MTRLIFQKFQLKLWQLGTKADSCVMPQLSPFVLLMWQNVFLYVLLYWERNALPICVRPCPSCKAALTHGGMGPGPRVVSCGLWHWDGLVPVHPTVAWWDWDLRGWRPDQCLWLRLMCQAFSEQFLHRGRAICSLGGGHCHWGVPIPCALGLQRLGGWCVKATSTQMLRLKVPKRNSRMRKKQDLKLQTKS